jgi:hypothetical protein
MKDHVGTVAKIMVGVAITITLTVLGQWTVIPRLNPKIEANAQDINKAQRDIIELQTQYRYIKEKLDDIYSVTVLKK